MKYLSCFFITCMLGLNGIEANSQLASAAQVIFDNTVNPTGVNFGPGCCQIGNEITLGGTARQLVQLSWLVNSQNVDIVSDIETKIYVNNGPEGVPSELLWDSGPLTGIPISGKDTFLNVSVPDIIVPDTITVTLKILDAAPVALGWVGGGFPLVGNFNASWLESSPGSWVQGFGPLGVRVTAVSVPEPSSVLLSIITGFSLVGIKGKKLWRVQKWGILGNKAGQI